MTNSELQEGICSAYQNLKIKNQFSFIDKLKKGGQIKNKKDTIHIKDKNKGKFTASAKAAGESVQEHAKSVLNNPNATPLQKRRANFARNAAKWKHANGGIIQKMQNAGVVLPKELVGMNYANAKQYWKDLEELDPRMRAGIMGNMYVESKMNPNAQNANYIGLTQLSKKQLYPWVSKTYGRGAQGELAYIKDYVRGKLNNNKYRGSYGYGSSKYIAAHTGNYTPTDSARLFQQYYERNGMREARTRQAAAEAIYKLFNVQKEEPKLGAQPISQLNLPPIVTQSDATAITKPVLPIQINR